MALPHKFIKSGQAEGGLRSNPVVGSDETSGAVVSTLKLDSLQVGNMLPFP